MINNEKNVTVEKDDLKIWLNSTAPPSVNYCPYYLLVSEQLVKETESSTLLRKYTIISEKFGLT